MDKMKRALNGVALAAVVMAVGGCRTYSYTQADYEWGPEPTVYRTTPTYSSSVYSTAPVYTTPVYTTGPIGYSETVYVNDFGGGWRYAPRHGRHHGMPPPPRGGREHRNPPPSMARPTKPSRGPAATPPTTVVHRSGTARTPPPATGFRPKPTSVRARPSVKGPPPATGFRPKPTTRSSGKHGKR